MLRTTWPACATARCGWLLSSLAIARGRRVRGRHARPGRLDEPGLLHQLRRGGAERRRGGHRRAAPASLGRAARAAPSVPASALTAVRRACPGSAAAGGRVSARPRWSAPMARSSPATGQPGLGINVAGRPGAARLHRGLRARCPRRRAGGGGHRHRRRRALPARPADPGRQTRTAPCARFRLAGTIDFGVNRAVRQLDRDRLPDRDRVRVTGQPGYNQIVAARRPGVSQATLVARIRALPAPGCATRCRPAASWPRRGQRGGAVHQPVHRRDPDLRADLAGRRRHRHLQHVHHPGHPARPGTGPAALRRRQPGGRCSAAC